MVKEAQKDGFYTSLYYSLKNGLFLLTHQTFSQKSFLIQLIFHFFPRGSND